jgi:hypothetical protein
VPLPASVPFQKEFLGHVPALPRVVVLVQKQGQSGTKRIKAHSPLFLQIWILQLSQDLCPHRFRERGKGLNVREVPKLKGSTISARCNFRDTKLNIASHT